MASIVANSWIYTTVLIENDWGEKGTGFIVQRKVADDQARAFLVTNKHVINSNPNLRQEAREITIHINMLQPDGAVIAEKGILPLYYADGTRSWREHPDPDVDVLVINATRLIMHFFSQLEMKLVDFSLLADRDILRDFDITIGEDVFVVGYPIGLTQGATNHPIVRSGIIATRIGESFEDEVDGNGSKRRRRLRGFLVDGATVPGSSGSPVVLKPTIGRIVAGTVSLDTPPPFLLGILAETKYAPVKAEKWTNVSFADLGLAFDAKTIKETIELFSEAMETDEIQRAG